MGIEKNKRPILADDYANIRLTRSTAASTALAPRGVISLATTSTAAHIVYTLASLPKRGRRFSVAVEDIASSSGDADFHINAAAGSFFGSTDDDMLSLTGPGGGASFVGLSSEIWGCIGAHNAVFSTST